MGIRSFLERRREARAVEYETQLGPPYSSQISELQEKLKGDLNDRRIRPGHA